MEECQLLKTRWKVHPFFPGMVKWNWSCPGPRIRAMSLFIIYFVMFIKLHLDGVIVKMQLILFFSFFPCVSVTEKKTKTTHLEKVYLEGRRKSSLSFISFTAEIKAMQPNFISSIFIKQRTFTLSLVLNLNLKSFFLTISLNFWFLKFNHVVPICAVWTALTHSSQLVV